ncbi:hypothetical protein SERLADRAFT_338909, partial [Serpula lacrymans var. lacrymans S7.9]
VLYLTRQSGFNVTISSHSMSFMCDNTLLFTATINDNNAAFLDGSTAACVELGHFTATIPLDLMLWHCRLAHHHHADVKRLIQRDLVTGLTLESKAAPDPVCEPCLSGKMHANPFPSSDTRSAHPLDLIHSDVHQVSSPTFSGYHYWVTFIDD